MQHSLQERLEAAEAQLAQVCALGARERAFKSMRRGVFRGFVGEGSLDCMRGRERHGSKGVEAARRERGGEGRGRERGREPCNTKTETLALPSPLWQRARTHPCRPPQCAPQAPGEASEVQAQLSSLQQQLEAQQADAAAALAAQWEQLQQEAGAAAAAAAAAARAEGAEEARAEATAGTQDLQERLARAEAGRQEAEEALRALEERASSAGQLQVGGWVGWEGAAAACAGGLWGLGGLYLVTNSAGLACRPAPSHAGGRREGAYRAYPTARPLAGCRRTWRRPPLPTWPSRQRWPQCSSSWRRRGRRWKRRGARCLSSRARRRSGSGASLWCR